MIFVFYGMFVSYLPGIFCEDTIFYGLNLLLYKIRNANHTAIKKLSQSGNLYVCLVGM